MQTYVKILNLASFQHFFMWKNAVCENVQI